MTVKEMCELGIKCGLITVGECFDNICLHIGGLKSYEEMEEMEEMGEMGNEVNELIEDVATREIRADELAENYVYYTKWEPENITYKREEMEDNNND